MATSIGGRSTKHYHEHKEYVEPHPINTTHNVASLQHRWSTIQEYVNKFVDHYASVLGRNQSGIGVQSHMVLVAALFQQVEKKPFGFSHCWMKLNGQPKWIQLVEGLKKSNKRLKTNDGSSSHQSIGADDEEEEVVGESGRATVPMNNRQVMGNKWEKGRAACDVAATKMSTTWTDIFSRREDKKEERYKLMLDARKERMDWDRERVNNKLELGREKTVGEERGVHGSSRRPGLLDQ